MKKWNIHVLYTYIKTNDGICVMYHYTHHQLAAGASGNEKQLDSCDTLTNNKRSIISYGFHPVY